MSARTAAALALYWRLPAARWGLIAYSLVLAMGMTVHATQAAADRQVALMVVVLTAAAAYAFGALLAAQVRWIVSTLLPHARRSHVHAALAATVVLQWIPGAATLIIAGADPGSAVLVSAAAGCSALALGWRHRWLARHAYVGSFALVVTLSVFPRHAGEALAGWTAAPWWWSWVLSLVVLGLSAAWLAAGLRAGASHGSPAPASPPAIGSSGSGTATAWHEADRARRAWYVPRPAKVVVGLGALTAGMVFALLAGGDRLPAASLTFLLMLLWTLGIDDGDPKGVFRADAVRPLSRARFASLVLAASALDSLRTWCLVIAGAAAVVATGWLLGMLATRFAIDWSIAAAASLALQPMFAAARASVVRMSGRVLGTTRGMLVGLASVLAGGAVLLAYALGGTAGWTTTAVAVAAGALWCAWELRRWRDDELG